MDFIPASVCNTPKQMKEETKVGAVVKRFIVEISSQLYLTDHSRHGKYPRRLFSGKLLLIMVKMDLLPLFISP